MRSWHPSIPSVILVLLLTSCGVADSTAAMSVPTTMPPTATPRVPSDTSGAVPLTALSTTNVMPNTPPKTCPVTRPADPAFTPPPPYPRYAPAAEEFWYGTDALWTAVPKTGVWSGLPHNPEGYTQKVFWWRKGYSWTAEPEPQLIVTGRRLDASASPLNVSHATNAFAEDIQSAMLVGVDFPTQGCWEITGQYARMELSFVVWVAP
jgi:hypothetical protein